MLWYKAWLETRSRFLLGIVLVSAVTMFFVLAHPFMIRQWQSDLVLHPDWPEPHWFRRALADYPYFLWHFLYAELLQNAWVLSAILLGLGGIAREAVQGTAGFTLSLPVSRRSLLAVRTVVAGAELVVLGFLPAILLPLGSALAGRSYPFASGLAHSALMVGGGLGFFGLTVLLSTVLRDEHTPMLIGVSAAALLFFVLQPYAGDALRRPIWARILDLPGLMAGPPDLASPGDVPWFGLVLSFSFTTLLLVASFRVSVTRDY
jgi:ABC-2 type transport system permease protein